MENSLLGVHDVGQMVLVPWKNSRPCFSRLEEVNFVNRTCLVRFEDGSKTVVALADVRPADSSFAHSSPCVVCNGQLSYSANAIVLCQTCHAGFHQQCHNPSISANILEHGTPWVCCYCREGRPSPHSMRTGAKEALLKSRKMKHDQSDAPAAKRVLQRTINAPSKFHRCSSLSDGESDCATSEYETSGGSPSPGSPVRSLLAKSVAKEETNNARFQQPTPLSELFKAKETSTLCKSAGHNDNNEKSPSGNQEDEHLGPSARQGGHSAQTAPERERCKGNEGIDDEEEFIDVEGDGDNTADSDELDSSETDSCGSARTRGDIQRKARTSIHTSPSALTASGITSFLSNSTRGSSYSSSKITIPTLSDKNVQNSNIDCNKTSPVTCATLYAWVSKVTARRFPMESDQPSHSTAAAKTCPTSGSQHQQRRATDLHQTNTMPFHGSSKISQQISMPRLSENGVNRNVLADTASSSKTGKTDCELSSENSGLPPQEDNTGQVSNPQKKLRTFTAEEYEGHHTPSVRQSCQPSDTSSDNQASVKNCMLKNGQDISRSVQLQNPFRQWVCLNAQQPKSQTPPPTPSQRLGAAALNSRPATPSQKAVTSLKKHTSPSRSPLKAIQRPSSLPLSKTNIRKRKHETKRPSPSTSSESAEESYGYNMPPKVLLLAKLTAGYLAQPVDGLRMPWQVNHGNDQERFTGDQPSKCKSLTSTMPTNINIEDLLCLEQNPGSCTVCQQHDTRTEWMVWLNSFVSEYNKFMGRWEDRKSLQAKLPLSQN